jgi:hypothetical protein
MRTASVRQPRHALRFVVLASCAGLLLFALLYPGEARRRLAGTGVVADEAAQAEESIRSHTVQGRARAVVERGDAALAAGVRDAVRSMDSELTTALAGSVVKRAYDECSAGGRRCQAQLASALHYAIAATELVRAISENGYDLSHWVERGGSHAVAGILAEVVATSASPTERIAALLSLAHGPALAAQDRDAPLPEGAYRGLSDRPIPEAALIAAHHHDTPVPASAAHEFVQLARSDDVRARRAAFGALGHPGTAAELLEALMSAPLTKPHYHHAALAIAKCGLRCSDSLQYLMGSGASDARIAMYEAVAFASDAERRELVQIMRGYSEPATDAVERQLEESLLSDALAETH